jgi:hypothetical protein
MAKLKGGTRIYGSFKLDGGLYDANNQVGSASSILVSTGAGVSWTTSFAAGLQGLQGTQGVQATQGTQGAQGLQGRQGTQGVQATQGTQGVQATQGTQGVQATQGTQGSQATQGTQGVQATQGTQGVQATQGTQGVQATQGTQGSQATQGTQGVQATQGTQGSQATQGTQGVQATQGTQGSQATQGTQGVQATQGTQGSQATQGTQGVQATQGTQGVQATQGTQGSQATQGTQGSQATQGTQGVQATQGTQGVQATQGTQGTQGLQGRQGSQGTQGLQGLTGPVAGSANQIVYKNASNVAIGSDSLTYTGAVSGIGTVGIGTIIDIVHYDTLNSGTLSWEGSSGQLFSITNNLTSGSIFSVNDVSGIPSIDVNANGTVSMVSYGGSLGIGTTLATQKLDVNGNIRLRSGLYDSNNTVGVAGSILISTGAGVSWTSSSAAGTINATNDTSTTTLYPVMVGALGSNQTPKGASTRSLVYNASSGNLGIGATNPQTKLEVGGALGFGTVQNIIIGDVNTGARILDDLSLGDTIPTGNFFAGVGAGKSSGYSFIDNASDNVFIGSNAGGWNIGGNDNIFIGSNAGGQNVSGQNNVFLGPGAGYGGGGSSICIGQFAGYTNAGSANNFIGLRAGYNNLSGGSNNFFGYDSGFKNTNGTYNSFIGEASGYYNTTGNFNTFIGGRSGISSTASYKMILGAGSDLASLFDAPSPNKNTQFAVGVRTDANPSKYWLVGDENFNVGIGTTNPTAKLWVGGNGFFTGIVTSSGFYVGGQLVGSSISGTNIVGTALSISGISTSTYLDGTPIQRLTGGILAISYGMAMP